MITVLNSVVGIGSLLSRAAGALAVPGAGQSIESLSRFIVMKNSPSRVQVSELPLISRRDLGSCG
jgi:hypothetical protein